MIPLKTLLLSSEISAVEFLLLSGLMAAAVPGIVGDVNGECKLAPGIICFKLSCNLTTVLERTNKHV